jgi:hypothetical protein
MDELELLAFLDESNKPVRDPATGKVADSGNRYVVAAAVVLRGEAEPIRNELRALRDRIGYDLHYSDLGRKSRTQALIGLSEIDGWEGAIYETDTAVSIDQSERRTRHLVHRAAFINLTNHMGVTRIVVETRATIRLGFNTLDLQDEASWYSLRKRGLILPDRTMDHADKTEPLLWMAELLAGARTDHLCNVDRGFYPLIAHRIRHVTAVTH